MTSGSSVRTSVAWSPLAQAPMNFSATSLCSAVLTAARPWGCSCSIFPRARAASCRQDCARRPRVSPADRDLGAAGGAVRDNQPRVLVPRSRAAVRHPHVRHGRDPCGAWAQYRGVRRHIAGRRHRPLLLRWIHVSITALPSWLADVARVLPLTHALALFRYGSRRPVEVRHCTTSGACTAQPPWRCFPWVWWRCTRW